MSSLYLNEKLSDVTLKIRSEDGYSWRIPAHSLVLRNHCPPLSRMLEERDRSDEPTVITLVDLKPRTALHLIRYMYEEHIPHDSDLDLVLAAERYEMQTLQGSVEDRILSRGITVPEACSMIEGLRERGPRSTPSVLSPACLKILLKHATLVFCSDLVLELSEGTLEELLSSDDLNVPDEALVFWGLWRWAKRTCSRAGRCLDEETIASKLDCLLPQLRYASLKRSEGIPQVALKRFNRCRCRRRQYAPPDDTTDHCSALALPTRGWEGLVKESSDENVLCVQISCGHHVFLVGAEVELCEPKPIDVLLRVMREDDGKELHRERTMWDDVVKKQLSTNSDPDHWLLGSCTFSRPLLLTPGTIYSIYLRGNYSALPTATAGSRNRKVGSTTMTVHSPYVKVLRSLYFLTGVEVSWGVHAPRP